MKLRNKHILCFGEMLWDRLSTGSKPGGAPMNVALHLKRFGLSPWLASRVGDDDAGRELVDFLKQNKIKTGLVQRGKTLPTSEVIVHLDSRGNPSYEICEPVAWDNIAWTQKLAERAEQAGIIVFGTLAARSEITRNALLNLLKTKAYRILDVNLRPPYDRQDIVEMLISKSDFVKMSINELSTIAKWLELPWYSEESVMREMVDHFGLSGVCLTRGENGAALYVRGYFYENAGYRVDVVDTVGSGDAFLAAMLYSFTERKPPEEALDLACAAGALVASKSGANPEYSIEDVGKLMQRSSISDLPG
jgi:fructokinase